MATATANNFVTRALVALNVYASGDTVSATELTDGLQILNEMVSSWALQPGTLRWAVRTQINLVASDGDYTVGDGSHQVIQGVGLLADRTASPANETPIRGPVTLAEWQGITDKTQEASQPSLVYIDESGGINTLTMHPWPVPDNSDGAILLYIPQKVAQFADGTTSYTFGDGYERAIRYNLALELAANYDGVVPSPLVDRIARESLAWLKQVNRMAQLQEATFDPGLVSHNQGDRHGYDIYSDR